MAEEMTSNGRLDLAFLWRAARRLWRAREAAVQRSTLPWLGIPLGATLTRLPSFLVGGVRQVIANHAARATFAHRGSPAVMLVPGLFCTPSVMNGLGAELERQGLDVYLPQAFPHYRGLLANTGPVEASVELLLDELEILSSEHDVREVTLVGHSLGAVIVLLAAAAAHTSRRDLPSLRGVVLLSPPLEGAPIARLFRPFVPATAAIVPGSETLRRARAAAAEIAQVHSAAGDSLVPLASQECLPVPTVRFEHFQHMDFYLGSPERVREAALAIAEVVRKAQPGDGSGR
jgi:pimeloyl-ACP methyl ester carboxylesterase